MAWHPRHHIVELGLIEPRAEKQLGCFAAGITLLVLKASYLHLKQLYVGAIDEALRCKEKESVKPCSTCAVGHFDMQAYMAYQTGLLRDTRQLNK